MLIHFCNGASTENKAVYQKTTEIIFFVFLLIMSFPLEYKTQEGKEFIYCIQFCIQNV